VAARGVSMISQVRMDERIIEEVYKILMYFPGEAFRDAGSINVQGFFDGERFQLTEINPRFAGTANLSMKAGVDWFRYLRMKHEGRGAQYRPKPIDDGLMVRRVYRGIYGVGGFGRYAGPAPGLHGGHGGEFAGAPARRRRENACHEDLGRQGPNVPALVGRSGQARRADVEDGIPPPSGVSVRSRLQVDIVSGCGSDSDNAPSEGDRHQRSGTHPTDEVGCFGHR